MEKVEGWRNGEDEAIFEWKWWRESRPNEKRWREKRENGEKRDEDEVESEGMSKVKWEMSFMRGRSAKMS